jgi:hypothetical protein
MCDEVLNMDRSSTDESAKAVVGWARYLPTLNLQTFEITRRLATWFEWIEGDLWLGRAGLEPSTFLLH